MSTPPTHLQRVPPTFQSFPQYHHIWLKLLEKEKEAEIEELEQHFIDSAHIEANYSHEAALVRTIVFDEKPNFSVKKGMHCSITPTQTLSETEYEEFEGCVIEAYELSALIRFRDYLPDSLNRQFDCEFQELYDDTAFQRKCKALAAFCDDSSTCSHLQNIILNSPGNSCAACPSTWSLQTAPSDLNTNQVRAVRTSIENCVTLIQGPPGTGKTVVAAKLALYFTQRRLGKVLVCAPSNVATDHLAQQIHQAGMKVLRICANWYESLAVTVKNLTLDARIEQLDTPESRRYLYLKRLERRAKLNKEDAAALARLKEALTRHVLEQHDVVCCTLVGSGADALSLTKAGFGAVLVDEAGMAIEPECLVPLQYGAKKLVLIGDHRQLGSVVLSPPAQRAGLGMGLFQRLQPLAVAQVMLTEQRRMHPALAVFPSRHFYEGKLVSAVTPEERDLGTAHAAELFPQAAKPHVLIAVRGKEQRMGTSYQNPREAEIVAQAVRRLVNSGVKVDEIGVITPYLGQKTAIYNLLKDLIPPLPPRVSDEDAPPPPRLEISTVDAFQGREKEIIIFSCVRSGTNSIGFLRDERRMNVALTRARRALVVVGNPDTLRGDPLWRSLVDYLTECKCDAREDQFMMDTQRINEHSRRRTEMEARLRAEEEQKRLAEERRRQWEEYYRQRRIAEDQQREREKRAALARKEAKRQQQLYEAQQQQLAEQYHRQRRTYDYVGSDDEADDVVSSDEEENARRWGHYRRQQPEQEERQRPIPTSTQWADYWKVREDEEARRGEVYRRHRLEQEKRQQLERDRQRLLAEAQQSEREKREALARQETERQQQLYEAQRQQQEENERSAMDSQRKVAQPALDPVLGIGLGIVAAVAAVVTFIARIFW